MLLTLIAVMKFWYPVDAAQVHTRGGTVATILLLAVVLAAGAIIQRYPLDSSSSNLRFLPLMRWWRDPLTPHVVASVIVWLVMGALPAYGLYKFAHGNQMLVMMMGEHAYVERAFAWRAFRLQDEYKNIPTLADGASAANFSSPHIFNEESRGVYWHSLLSRGVLADINRSDYETLKDRVVTHDFWEYFANRAPIYNEVTTYSRYFDSIAQGQGSRFTWVRHIRSGGESPSQPLLVYEHAGAGGCSVPVHSTASYSPMSEPYFGGLGALAAFALLPLLFAWSAFGARKLFFGDIEIEARRLHDAGDSPSIVQPGRLDLPPDRAWLETEVMAISDPNKNFSADTAAAICSNSSTRRTVADWILDQSRPFYAAEWGQCSDEDKLLLTQLVQEGFANPRQHEIVRRLLKRGLIRRDPVLRPMNDSFALFVEQQPESEDVQELENVDRGMRWSLVRNLLIAAGLLILIFLSVTQRDVVDVWAAYLSAAVGGVTGVLKLFSMFGRSGSQKGS
jgi:hypothetical protein